MEKRWKLVVDGRTVETFDNYFDAYDALEAHVGGDDFTTSLSCDSEKVFGFPTEEEMREAEGTECSYVPHVEEIHKVRWG